MSGSNGKHVAQHAAPSGRRNASTARDTGRERVPDRRAEVSARHSHVPEEYDEVPVRRSRPTKKRGGKGPLMIAAAVILIVLILVVVLAGRSKSKGSAEAAAVQTRSNAAESTEATAPAAEESTGPEQLYDEPAYFTISCIGDNTLWSSIYFEQSSAGLPLTVGEDYAYPFANTVQYFADDELTLANLENTFSDSNLKSAEQFYFLAPTAYANILTQGGVDFVTTANNHMEDFGDQGEADTYAACENVGLAYGTDLQGQIITTKSGLKIGIYTAGDDLKPIDHKDQILEGIAQLQADGAQYIICMFHWGKELYYTPNDNQTELAHACIDAGADLVYGSHPHCLEPVEQYNDGLILYSMGNWVFGGNTAPTDPDTAIIQIVLQRDVYGNLTTDSFSAIPCCVSGNIDAAQSNRDNYNNYQPTPYEEGSEAYERVLSKLSGTYEAASQGKDYSSFYASWG